MKKVKKDNLTDLISDLTEPKASSSPSEPQKPVIKPPKGLNDYQVITPDGEVIDLTFNMLNSTIQKSQTNTFVQKIIGATDKKGTSYILIINKNPN